MVRSCWSIAFLIETLSLWIQVANTDCPAETDYVHRIGQTRFYILQNLKRENCQKNNGHCVDYEQAKGECEKHSMKLAKIKNMLALAIVGRPLEKLVEANGLKDTWYWLAAHSSDSDSEKKYVWEGDDGGFLEYSNFLYRPPRPTGVGGFVDWKGEYHPNSNIKQCLSLTLPWPGKGDPHGKGAIYGHHTMFDERPCESRQKRHALCETNEVLCKSNIDDPFVLTEDKTKYFDEGDWIFGDRRYMVNWHHKTVKDAKLHCKKMGLKLYEPEEGDENGLIPYLKMWSREVTVSQFWTGYNWNIKKQTYIDRKNQSVAESKSSANGKDYCVAMVLSYEFKGQLPCEDQTSPNCTWSFVDYIPANCYNYLPTICEHKDKRSRDSMWDSSYVLDVDKALKETAVTKQFGFKGNVKLLRSKFKQTFGSSHCPDGYRMLREKNVDLVTDGITEEYLYDFKETYWLVDDELFDKDKNSMCTVTVADKNYWTEERSIEKVNCTEWHFYLCEKFYYKTYPAPGFTFPTADKMIWKEGPQPRIYPLIIKTNSTPVSGNGLEGRISNVRSQSQSRTHPHTNGIFENWILKSVNKTERGFTVLGRAEEFVDEMSPKPHGF